MVSPTPESVTAVRRDGDPRTPDADDAGAYPGPWTAWACRLAAVGVWAVFTVGGLFLWALSYAGPNTHDERGMALGPSQAEQIAVLAFLIVLLVLMLAAVEVPLRAARRSRRPPAG